MNQWSEKFAAIITTLWVGALWAIGFIAARVLFNALPDDRLMAGMLAGRMFIVVSYIGMFSAFYLLVYQVARFGLPALKQAFFWAVVVMLVLTLIGHFGIQPLLAHLKAQAMPADVMQSVFADRFKAWHGIASISYLAQCLLGIVLVLKR
jgi:hypothetical protein